MPRCKNWPIDRAHASIVLDDCRFGITSCTVTHPMMPSRLVRGVHALLLGAIVSCLSFASGAPSALAQNNLSFPPSAQGPVVQSPVRMAPVAQTPASPASISTPAVNSPSLYPLSINIPALSPAIPTGLDP